MTGNQADVNFELLTWLPLDAKRILEIGREHSSLAIAYKERNPLAKYKTIDIQDLSRQVWLESVNDAAEGAGERFDLVVMNDVLHRLDSPSLILKRLHEVISDSAHLAICVRNLAHWSCLVQLLAGSLPTPKVGQHRRDQRSFFTLESLSETLCDCGFELLKARPRNVIIDREGAERSIPPLVEMAERMGLDRHAFLGRLNALQYVVVAKRLHSRHQTRLLRVHVNAMAPRFLDVRTRLPAEGLNSLPDVHVTTVDKSLRLPSYPVDAPKVCVLQRLAVSNASAYLSWVRDRIREGWMIVAESDDHPALLAAVHGRDLNDEAWLPMSAAHAVQTSTVALSEAYRRFNPEVANFPNSVFSLLPFVKKSGPIRVFLGALNREGITKKVAETLRGFCEQHSDSEFIVVHDKAFFDALAAKRKTFHSACSYEVYLNLMGSCDVALMPLEGTPGEVFKSDVKFLEASSRSVISIASPAVYEHTIKNNETGLIAYSLSDWPDLLNKVASNPEFRMQLAYEAWSYVRQNRMFAVQVGSRREWYNSLWSRRDELNKMLMDRHFQLR